MELLAEWLTACGGRNVEQFKIMNVVTNGLAGMAETAAQVVSAINAWNVVALGLGAALTHAYHRVVAAGGVKRIWSNFWDGPGGRTAAGEPPSAGLAGKRGPGN